jgi:hypothetical protein
MRRTRTPHRGRVRLAVSSVFVLAVVLAVAGPAGAKTIQVAGTQTVVDEAAGAYEMHGSLVGKWNITAFKEHFKDASNFVGSGKETFVGCIDSNRNAACDEGEPSGSMKFTFVYWATLDPATGALVRGQCVHPVAGGNGSFVGAKGVIVMKDKPVGDEVKTTYTGTLAFGSNGSSARSLSARARGGC